MAKVTRPVMMGRSMKMRETCIFLLRLSVCFGGGGRLDAGAWIKSRLSVRHHCFTGRDALLDDDLCARARAGRNRPRLHRLVLFDDVNERPLLSSLDRFRRHA